MNQIKRHIETYKLGYETALFDFLVESKDHFGEKTYKKIFHLVNQMRNNVPSPSDFISKYQERING